MGSMNEREPCYQFERFLLDPNLRTLQKDGEEIRMTPLAFSLLLYLVSNPNRLLTKAELIEKVWGRTVAHNTIAQCISSIREALEDQSKSLIKTHFAKGYSFIGQVTRCHGGKPVPQPGKETASRLSHTESDPQKAEQQSWIARVWGASWSSLLSNLPGLGRDREESSGGGDSEG